MTELAYRHAEQVEVSLLWARQTDDLVVVVEDEAPANASPFPPRATWHSTCYHHPFAYGAGASALARRRR